MIKKSRLLALLLLPVIGNANPLPQPLTVPGGIAEIPLGPLMDAAPQVFFQQHRVLVTHDDRNWLALVGIPLETQPGQQEIVLKTQDKSTRIAFNVNYKEYPAQYLSIKNKRMVNPNPEDLKRINADLQRINAAIGTWTEQERIDTDFTAPVDGRLSGVFGSRRFFNNQAKNPHSGLDIAAPPGAPIKAPAGAKVIDTGNYYYNGNAVFLDHGQGLISGYFHMTEIKVKPGQTVNRGDLIGSVGATGRVTGPHLHWNIYLNNTKVDPALFIAKDLPRLEARNHK